MVVLWLYIMGMSLLYYGYMMDLLWFMMAIFWICYGHIKVILRSYYGHIMVI